jgi:ATP-dependent exoDNAse (exonuclease V) alpha subunit
MMTRDANKVGRPLNVRLSGNQLKIPHDVVMQREQYRFLPAYCITVNASQGRTLESVVICLDGGYTWNAKPYVMWSRLTNGRALGIIGKIPLGI